MTETITNGGSGRQKISQWNLILIGLLILQSLVIGWTYYWESDSGAVEVGPLFGELETDDIDSLAIAGTDDAEALQLVRVDDGWAVASRDDFPANGEKIDGVVEKLLAMDTNRLVTKTSASHKRLQVADDTFASRVMVTADGDEQTLYVGSAPSAGATHIRLADENETYLTSEIASWELGTQLSSWIDTSYLDVAQENVTSFTLQNGNGDFTFIREGEGWVLRGLLEGTVNASEVNSLLGRAATLRMTEPLGKTAQDGYGMGAPLATVTLDVDDGEGNTEEIVLTVGSKNADGDDYVMKASTSDYYVNVSGFTGDGFVDKVQADFLEEVVEEEPVEAEITELAPVEEAAVESLVDDEVIEDKPAEEVPTEDLPVEDEVVEEEPAEEADAEPSVDDEVVDNEPAEDASAEEEGVAEAPVDDEVVEEEPVEDEAETEDGG